MRVVDLTHPLSPDVPTWKGNCGFRIQITKDYGNGEGTKFRNQDFSLEAGVGTHMDAPAHCIQGALAIADLPLEELISPCVVIDISDKANETYSLLPQDIEEFERKHGSIETSAFIIVYTGWSRFWPDPEAYRNDYRFPSIFPPAAEMLLERKMKGLGIDTLSPDRPESGYPVHQLLLGAGKYIVENVANANLLSPKGWQAFALPLKIIGATESPMRLIALSPEG
jgi:kynurenine formamidase